MISPDGRAQFPISLTAYPEYVVPGFKRNGGKRRAGTGRHTALFRVAGFQKTYFNANWITLPPLPTNWLFETLEVPEVFASV